MTTKKAVSMNDSTAANDAPDWGALLARVAENDDKAAFRAIYQHFAPRIKAYAINQGFSQHAEVLVQEVMTSVWRNADKYSESLASVSTWIFTITRNQRIDILRKLNRTRAEIVIETEDLWQIPTEDTTICSIQNLSTEKFVKAAIDKLPEEQMIALRKVYYEGKTHEEVAEELNIPLGTVKGRLRLSLQKLRVMFEAKEI
ncbi:MULTISPECIES: sigma-70 family RNA polymerase sigma factor [Cellvibrio]|jgi:RNA polymerase sigma-70 factor (ECF subfamily)|uniref:RNA polymerase sigma-70 factor (ECF subfamily) n=1 Tax=Cellvibrio fibrivorans TaxID=126350 RepID=A0ABU1USJ2_9GAMM|nr:sigma-70 family RNA polymerase sigma factor [Cellvibrio fibrivorans]MDR7088155.1 RNA polymerase sigma-70 factor (ECF subfamily) [Cellvibrio fibrivorans]